MAVTDIASPEDLLSALGQESPAVAARIQRLLLPSYFPNIEDGPALVAYLLRSRPEAGLAFCDFLCGSKARGKGSLSQQMYFIPALPRMRRHHCKLR